MDEYMVVELNSAAGGGKLAAILGIYDSVEHAKDAIKGKYCYLGAVKILRVNTVAELHIDDMPKDKRYRNMGLVSGVLEDVN